MMADSATFAPNLDQIFQDARPDIFLSYSRLDTKVAGELARALEAEGFRVWWDKDIQSGSDWRKTIEMKVARARCVVLIWSKRAER
jgi:hypothetical protein